MIYLPLYVMFEYTNLDQYKNNVFYSIPESRWYLTDNSVMWTMYQNALAFDGIFLKRTDGTTDIGPPTTLKKTNERIREVLRVIYEDKPLPKNIRTYKSTSFVSSLIHGKKTKRITFGIKPNSNRKVLNVNPHNINKDSWVFTMRETPIYRTLEKFTVCIYSWYVRYVSRENNHTSAYVSRFCAPYEIEEPGAALNSIRINHSDPYSQLKIEDGILERFAVDFDYVTPDGCLKIIHANVQIYDDFILDVQREGCKLNAQSFSLDGEDHSSYVSFPVRKRRIPTNLISEPNLKKAKDVIAFFIREYFDL